MAQSREIEKLQRRWQENPLGLTFAPLAEAYRKEGMHEEALELLELGLAQHPNYVPAHIVCARCQIDVGEDAKAEASFLRVADLDPENVIALRGVADIAERGGRFQEAATRLEALLLFDRNNEEAKSHLTRVRALLAMPTPGTIDPDAATVEVATPEQTRPVEVPEVRGAPEPTVSISMPEPEPEPEPEQAPVAEASEQAVHLTGKFVEDEVDAVEAGAAAGSSGATGESIEEAAPADAVAEFAEPDDQVAATEAGVDAGEEVEATPELAEDAEVDLPPSVEAAVLADPDLEVELYHPMELTAASATEYQQASDAEALRGGGAEDSGEQGERVPLFVAGSGEPGPPEPSAEEKMPVEPALEAEHDGSSADEESADGDESGDGADEPELVVTETMAEVFLRQGHRELALAVYAQLRQREPDNARIQSAIDDLEQELRPARGTSMPAFAAALTGGRSVRGYFEDLLTAPAPAPNGGDGLALGSVFGDEPGAAPEPEAEPEGGPSFDEFFAGDAPEPAAGPGAEALPAPAAASEDIEEFNAWLRGLKR